MLEQLIGQTLDRYAIQRQVRENAFSTTFKAYDPALQRDVALMVINPSLTTRLNFADNFIRSARIAARLDHPSIIKIFDFGEDRSFQYIVTEYIPGGNLGQLLAELKRGGRWILLEEAVSLVRQLALAMQYALDQGVVQRSINPASILVKPVQSEFLPYLPVVSGLGLAGLVGDGVGENPAIDPAYLSPEGALGRVTDSRSDVYSLGVLLFELVTGQLPFQIQTIEDAVRSHVHQPIPHLRSQRPDLPGALENAIVKALEKNPEGRFRDLSSFSQELTRLLPVVTKVTAPPPGFDEAVSLLVPYKQSLGGERDSVIFEDTAATRVGPIRPLGGEANPVLELVLENPHLTVEPGNSVTMAVTVINREALEGRFRLLVNGLPESWVSITPPMLTVEPGAVRDASLTIHPPRASLSRAGRYPLIVQAMDQANANRTVETRGAVTIGPFTQFTSELFTSQLSGGQVGQVNVRNLGNMQETFTFDFRDPRGELAFTPPQAPLRLAENQSGVAEFRADLRRPRWLGDRRSHPFTVQVVASNGESQSIPAEFISVPVVPSWVIGMFLLVLLCTAALLAYYLSQTGIQVTSGTQTAIAQQTGTAAAFLTDSQSGTATAEFLANANQATLQAATATATWLSADPDGDGLTNEQELKFGTLIDNPDSDGDGLTDGQEVQLGTNPVKADTDGDGLSDGDEVKLGTNPLKPDTDGDGLIDSLDPSPLQTSTPIPDIAGTQGASASATAAAAQQTAEAGSELATAVAGTAVAQTAVAGTAAAATATADQSAQLTATAIAAVTPSPAPGRRLAYIYSTDNATAVNYQQLLATNGFSLDLIAQADVLNTDFSPYLAVLIGPETGTENQWGDDLGAQVNQVLNTNLPVIGLGQGGAALFGKANLEIGWKENQVITTEGTSVLAIHASDPAWTTPYKIDIPDRGTVILYDDSLSLIAIPFDNPPQNVALIGQMPDGSSSYPIVSQDGRFLLWGFSGPPASMTLIGQQVFINIVESLVP